MGSVKALVEKALALAPVMSRVKSHTKSTPEEEGIVHNHIRRRRTRHRVDGTDRRGTDRQVCTLCCPSANAQQRASPSTAADVNAMSINNDLSQNAFSGSLLQATRL